MMIAADFIGNASRKFVEEHSASINAPASRASRCDGADLGTRDIYGYDGKFGYAGRRKRPTPTETGLDYFGARYFSGAQGRFARRDPPIHIMPQKLLDPQQWNMYSYVRNSPLRLTDPTGMYICNGTESEYKDFDKARRRDLKSKKEAVRNATGAYGAVATDNGVNVSFGDPGHGHGGSTTVGLRQLANGSWQTTADVVIKKGTRIGKVRACGREHNDDTSR